MTTNLQFAFGPSNRHSRSYQHLLIPSMADIKTKPFALVPELALLEPLPLHHKKRFKKALDMMHNSLPDSLSWEQIAEKSAISPFHFHRQFSQLFNETPGHYLSRVRLQYAVFLLYMNQQTKVTEIAHQCGFSSSQALAKVLKRELGMSAKSLRKFVTHGTPAETALLWEKLAHPGRTSSVERQLAESIPTELVWYPKRGMKVQAMPDFDWDEVFDTYGSESSRLISATPVADLERAWNEISYTIGDWKEPADKHDFYLPEGYYFCCEVYLVTDVAFIAAIDSLFQQAEHQGLNVDQGGFLIELVRDVDLTVTGGATFSFQIPIVM